MAIVVNSSITSYSILSGRNLPLHYQGCYTDDPGYCQWVTSFGSRTVMYEGLRNKLGTSQQATCAVRFDGGNHSFGLSDWSVVTRAKKLRHTKVQVAADYSDSKFEHHSELGYHPLEEVSDGENVEKGDLRLSDAEIARSTVKANHSAILVLPGTVHQQRHEEVSLTELQYFIDDYGDIYVESNNDENILRSHRATNIPVNAFIGLDELQIYGEQKRLAFENYNNIYTIDISGTNNKDDNEEDWSSITYEEDDSDNSDSIRDWAKLDTVTMVHPMYFAKKIAKVVSTNYSEKMDTPSYGLAIIGYLKPALIEEEFYLRGTDYLSGDDDYTEEYDQFRNEWTELSSLFDEGEGLIQAENQRLIELGNMSNSEYLDITNSNLNNDDPDLTSMISPEDEVAWPRGSESDNKALSSSMYKLEILSIQLMSVYGYQSSIGLEDFQEAEPDILASSSSAIISRFNAGSWKKKRALKALCQKRTGLDVEEALLVGVDSLGVDIRVHCGAEVQTVRIAFNCRATSEVAAKKQLQRLLFPLPPRRRRSHRDCYKRT